MILCVIFFLFSYKFKSQIVNHNEILYSQRVIDLTCFGFTYYWEYYKSLSSIFKFKKNNKSMFKMCALENNKKKKQKEKKTPKQNKNKN